jgi:hypothetical protein
MPLIHIGLLWCLVCVHVVGGACLFHRLFRRESSWFGFVLPALALALVMNFIEHGVGFSTLRWPLPVTFLGSLWMIVSPGNNWRRIWQPTSVFLVAFTFTLFIHALKPDVEAVRDGRLDIHLIADYSMGSTLPPVSTWEAPFKQKDYYSFEHYAASVMDRLMGFDLGTGFNMAGALLSAFIFFLIAATAWRLGGQKVWIVCVCVLLTASAMTGSTAYLWLFAPNNKDPGDTANLLAQMDATSAHSPVAHLLPRIDSLYDQRELLVPGYWGWIGSFHSTVAGQFLTLLAVYCLVEMVRRRRTNLPWVCGLGVCLLMLVCSSWGLPFMGLLFLCGAGWCVSRKIYPRNFPAVCMGWGAIALCMTPLLSYFLQQTTPDVGVAQPHEHAQIFEWVLQWWPVYVPWFALLFFWRKLSPATLIVMVMVPLGLLATERYSIADRLDMSGKMWGFFFGAAWAVLVPTMASIRAYWMRGILAVFLISGGLSMCFWVDYTHRTLQGDDQWRIDGRGDLRSDSVKGRLLNTLGTMNHQMILTGECMWAYNESPSLASFSHNYDFIADDFDCDQHFNDYNFGEGQRRADAINAIYAGKSPDALTYLRDHRIVAIVVWPDDQIPNDVLAKLKAQLAADYWYQDCRNSDAPSTDPNAGIFLTCRSGKSTNSLAAR